MLQAKKVDDQVGSIDKNGRIAEHPILGSLPAQRKCTIIVDSKRIAAVEGEPILAALLAAGIYIARNTEKYNQPRGLYCGIGVCTDCLVTVDGRTNVRSCVTPVRPGMVVWTGRKAGSSGA
jgi:predicted molibdopterin-dependent oxidoreductase YjgC